MDREKLKTAFNIACLFDALFFILRFWHFLIASVFMTIVFAIPIFFSKSDEKREKKSENMQNTISENKDSLYNDVAKQITEKVRADFPEARWVFTHPKAISVLRSGSAVNIVLNGAGGYRKAEVRLKDGVIETEYITEEQKQRCKEPTEPETERKEIAEDYGLMAFEWVESHIGELNGKLNEKISEGEKEHIIVSAELPDERCWESVCEELKRQGLKNAETVPNGIKIIIK